MGDGETLPALRNCLDLMSNNELNTFISQIIRTHGTVSRVKSPLFGDPSMKPAWWPGYLPFTNLGKDPRDQMDKTKKPWVDEMRNIVRQCYKYHGQEHLLNADDAIKVVNNQDGSVSFITHNTVVTLEDRQNTPYASCPTTEAATPGRSLTASTGPLPLPTGLFRSTTNMPAVTRSQKGTVRSIDGKPFVEVFMCFFCEKEFHHKTTLQRHQRECSQRPPELMMGCSTTKLSALKETVHVMPRKPRKLVQEKVTFPVKGVYIETLGLLPQAKADSMRRLSIGRKINCDVIEVEENKPPKTPTTPRTPKSLISQLSRDASPPARLRLKIDEAVLSEEADTQSTKDGSEDEDSECGKSDNGEDSFRPRRVAPLLNIDITSVLGDRVKKHISAHFANMELLNCSDTESPKKTYEDFCRTPTKIKVIDRLRSRGKDNFQVTWRKTKRLAPKYTYKYKFRRSDGHEFCRIVETGLNKKARMLKRQVKKCRVIVQRLSMDEIANWCEPRITLPAHKHAAIDKWIADGRSPFTNASFSEEPTNIRLHKQAGPAQLLNRHVPNILRRHGRAELHVGPVFKQQLFHSLINDFSADHAGVTGSPADLTPPNTPEDASTRVDDEDLIIMDDGSTTSLHLRLSQSSGSPDHKPILPCNSARRNLQDDIISISSGGSSSDLKVVSPESLKRAISWSPTTYDLPQKKRKVEHSAALLFRCHLCFEEITCYDNANVYIKGHFASKHDVHNIDLIEHLDTSGNKVVSIVEVPTPVKKSVPAPVNKPTPPAQPTLDSKKFYSQKKCSSKAKPQPIPQPKPTRQKETSSVRSQGKLQKKSATLVQKHKVVVAPNRVAIKKASKVQARELSLKNSELRKKMRDTLRPIINIKAKAAKSSKNATPQSNKKRKVLPVIVDKSPKPTKPVKVLPKAKDQKKSSGVIRGASKNTRPRKA